MDPVAAIRSATYQTAQTAHIDNLGAIAPGFAADFLLVDDLRELVPSHVFFGGRLVAQGGKLVADIPRRTFPLEEKNAVCVRPLTARDFTVTVPVSGPQARVRVLEYPDPVMPFTLSGTAQVPVRNGEVVLDDPDMKYVAVVNRYPDQDTIGLGIVKGFGLRTGAVASTVSHDCHNLTVVYDTPENALLAANTLIRCGGGMCAVKEGWVLSTLELPIAGLMSPKSAEELSVDSRVMKEAMRKLGLREIDNPLLRIVTLALPVVPELKITDMGLVDVLAKKVVPLLAD